MKLIKKANPNRHGRMLLEQDDDGTFWITEPYDGEYETDPYEVGTDEAEATACFDRVVKQWSETPNWEAQSAYDEIHGTDNGYAPWQFPREY